MPLDLQTDLNPKWRPGIPPVTRNLRQATRVDDFRVVVYPYQTQTTVLTDRVVSISWSDDAERASVEASLTLDNWDGYAAQLLAPGTWLDVQRRSEQTGRFVTVLPRLYVWSRALTDSYQGTATVEAMDVISLLQQQAPATYYFRADKKHKKGWTASEIATRVLRDLEVNARVIPTKFRIDYMMLQSATPFEVIVQAFARDRQQTGVRYRIRAGRYDAKTGGLIDLRAVVIDPVRRSDYTWDVADGLNIQGANWKESLQGVATDLIFVSPRHAAGTDASVNRPPSSASATGKINQGRPLGGPGQGTHTLGYWQSDNAQDIGMAKGTPIYAWVGGTVTTIREPGTGGDGVVHETNLDPGDMTSRFAGYGIEIDAKFYYKHLSSKNVNVGDTVAAGDQLGLSGGANGSPHLHFAAKPPDEPTHYMDMEVTPTNPAPGTPTSTTTTTGAAQDSRRVRVVSANAARYGRRRLVFLGDPGLTPRDMEKQARSLLRQLQVLNREASVEVEGLPLLRSCDALSVTDRGTRLNGIFFIKGVQVGLNAGQYQMTVDLSYTQTFPEAEIDDSTFTPDSGTSQAGVGSAGLQAVQFAMAQIGKPYVWGATGPDSYDCSGLTQAAWKSAGVDIPRVTQDQINCGEKINSVKDVAPGDLLFPSTGHVKMAVNATETVEAPHTGDVVKTGKMASSYLAIRRPQPLSDQGSATQTDATAAAISAGQGFSEGSSVSFTPNPEDWYLFADGEIDTAQSGATGGPQPLTGDAATFASQIRVFLTPKNSPFLPELDAMVAACMEAGTDPRAVVAISGIETSFGTTGGAKTSHNAWGWAVHQGKAFANFTEGAATVAAGLAGSTYRGAGKTTIAQIGPTYAPPSENNTNNWVSSVSSFYRQMGGNPSGTIFLK